MAPGAPEGVRVVSYDVTSEDAARDGMARIAQHGGHLDILVNAAGIETEKTIEDTSLEEWRRSFAVNVDGMFLTSK